MSGASCNLPDDLLDKFDAAQRPRLRPLLRRLENPEYYRKWMEIILPYLNYFMHEKRWDFTLYRNDGTREYTTSEYFHDINHLILQFDEQYTFRHIKAARGCRIPARIEIDEKNNVKGLGNASIRQTGSHSKFLFEVIAWEFTQANSSNVVLYWIDEWIEERRPDLRKLLGDLDDEFVRENELA
jgi:hypothetical protein